MQSITDLVLRLIISHPIECGFISSCILFAIIYPILMKFPLFNWDIK